MSRHDGLDDFIVISQQDVGGKIEGSSIKAKEKEASTADVDDPLSTTPMPRYNSMLSILRNSLYMLVNLSISAHNY